jgi:MFS transporter, ACS family, tartrate transporter
VPPAKPLMNDPLSSAQSATRKVKARIVPFLLILYVVAFLDRINIGFAALSMNNELGISSREFGLLSGVFFLGYFVFEIPSNLLLHRFGARVWIARIMVTWVIVAPDRRHIQTRYCSQQHSELGD